MGFPFYQGLNPLLNGKSNKDTPLSSDRRRARAGPWGGVGPLGSQGPAARKSDKILRPLDKGVSLLNLPFNNGLNP